MREILQKAMEIEQATQKFYEENAASANDDRIKELFTTLAKQELEHYLIVSSLAEYFDRPAEWVESAEFGLRPEYYPRRTSRSIITAKPIITPKVARRS